MKIIDLLNKIANGDKVPETIKYKDFKYKYSNEIGWYRRLDDLGIYDEWFINKNRLNDEVEIIEDKEYNKLQYANKEYDLTEFFKKYKEPAFMMKDMGDKIREIIDYVNNLEEKINKKLLIK